LGISFFEYVRDLREAAALRYRICETRIIPSLATIIREKSSANPLGSSWQPE